MLLLAALVAMPCAAVMGAVGEQPLGAASNAAASTATSASDMGAQGSIAQAGSEADAQSEQTQPDQAQPGSQNQAQSQSATQTNLRVAPSQTPLPDIREAPIVLLVDMTSGQTLVSRNANRRFIPASITKVMTLYVAFDLIKAGKLDPNTQMEFTEQAAKQWYREGSTLFLEPGEQVAVDTLLRGIAAVSANDGCITLAQGALGSVPAWVTRMNDTAKALGMSDSHFATPNGWPDGGATFTTARDLEILAEAMVTNHPELYREYIGLPGFNHNGYNQANHDPISSVIEGADGIKTGYTNQSGNGFLGSAARDGTRLVLVVAGVEQLPERDRISRDLITWGFDAFDRQQIYAQGQPLGSARVQNGDQPRVDLVTSEPVIVASPKAQGGAAQMAIRYHGPLRAPVAKGEEVAVLQISGENIPTAEIPLQAAHNVEKAGFFQRISNAFARWFG